MIISIKLNDVRKGAKIARGLHGLAIAKMRIFSDFFVCVFARNEAIGV